MMPLINIADHYWIIGGSTTDVYSSKTNTRVLTNDPAYVEWTGGLAASPIASEAELATVLQAMGSQLPAWLWNAPSFIQPTPTTYSKPQLAAYNADARYRKASGGIKVTSLGGAVPFLTDPQSRNTVNSAYQYAVANPAHVTDWKMTDGSFVKLNLTQLTTLNNDMTTFVQSCFTCESTTLTSINGGSVTTLTQIDTAFSAISSTFP
jgi:hypothetical protein